MVTMRIEPAVFGDPATRIVVEQIREASPADGITIGAGRGSGPVTVARIEFPMGVVDPGAVALLRAITG